MTITAQTLAALLGGTVEGDPSVSASRPGKIESGQADEICFLGNAKYEHYAYTTNASILLVANDFVAQQPVRPTLVRVPNVYEAVALLLEKFGKQDLSKRGGKVSERASVAPSVSVGANVSVGDFVVIEAHTSIGNNTTIFPQCFIGQNVTIGEGSILYAGVRIYDNTVIGENCIIHAGAVIGSDGFGFAPLADGSYKKIHHAGNVILGKNVEVGANTTIDKGSIGATRIGDGVKLDNLVQIAHNAEIGENTVIAAQTGVAGSTKIGKNCRIGGQVGFGGHLVIGDNVQIQGQSGVTTNIESGAKLYGTPAYDFTSFLRSYAVFKKLPDINRLVNTLAKKIEKNT